MNVDLSLYLKVAKCREHNEEAFLRSRALHAQATALFYQSKDAYRGARFIGAKLLGQQAEILRKQSVDAFYEAGLNHIMIWVDAIKWWEFEDKEGHP